MRICHLTTVHSYNDVRIFLKECVSLKEVGYEVHLIAKAVPGPEEKGIFLHEVSRRSSRRLTRMLFVSMLMYKKALKIDADLYHFHDPELIPIGLLLKYKGKKVIYDAHEDVPQQILTKHWIPIKLRRIVAKCFEIFEKKAAKKFDFVITATDVIKNKFIKKGCRAESVYNYPIIDEFVGLSVSRSPQERFVCYVGGISRIRGLYEMIEGVRKADATLLLAGRYSSVAEQTEVNKMEGYSNVHELGYLNREEVADVYASSHAGLVLLHPMQSYIDSLPVKMLEYMASGLPVIASNFPAWRDIIEGYNCGICVNPLDAEEISKAITRLIENEKEAKLMGENGRKAILEKFNWNIEKEKLAGLYGKIFDVED